MTTRILYGILLLTALGTGGKPPGPSQARDLSCIPAAESRPRYSIRACRVDAGSAGLLGYLRTWPTGQPQPNISTLNSLRRGPMARLRCTSRTRRNWISTGTSRREGGVIRSLPSGGAVATRRRCGPAREGRKYPGPTSFHQVSTARMAGGPGCPSMRWVSMTASRFRRSQFLGALESRASR